MHVLRGGGVRCGSPTCLMKKGDVKSSHIRMCHNIVPIELFVSGNGWHKLLHLSSGVYATGWVVGIADVPTAPSRVVY